ncbi:GH25 family lysozyme [Carnobacterium divergens]|uniref:GH25 family lysozyme n=1 Tax=Carnobacterium divergens TaxID=2748 RepID=UPI00107476C6|nr:phage tail protein [Carnobacterium divergens]TFI86902.1 hypothetical protein CKN61_12715 [Carnobacterium divergens]
MYRVIWFKDYRDIQGTVIHDTAQTADKLISGIINQTLDGIDTFNFSLSIDNKAFGKSKPLVSLITVLNTKTKKKEFEGRVRKIESIKMGSNGSFIQTVQCIGLLDYLHDSSQRFKDVQLTDTKAYVQLLIERHNNTVPAHKQFKLGNVTVDSNTGNVYRGIGYESTFDTIKDKLIDRLGGYIILKNQNGEMTIDYLKEYGQKIEQSIKITRNMIEAAKTINSDELLTRIVPLGSEIETSETETSSILARERQTISDVNNGIDYLEDEELIKEFGIIEKSVTWSDTNDHRQLKTKGEQYLRDQRTALITWGVTTVNLDLIDPKYQPFELGNFYPIDNQYLSPKEYQQIVEKKININQPHKVDLVLGTQKQTLSQYQLQYRGFSDQLESLQNSLDNSRKSLEELKKEAEALREIANRVPEQEKLLRELEERIKELENNTKPPEPTEQKGTDVSEHNTSIDWAKLKATGHTFVMVRGGYGQTTYDKLADRHTTGASAQGLKLGLYWFSYAKNVSEAIQEANKACDFADKYKGKFIYPIAWDWENDSERYVISQGVTPTKQLVSDMAVAFCNRVSERGYKPMNYSNLDYYNKYFDDRVKKYDWWLARPGVDKPDVPCTIWQNELDVDGTSRGINGNADFDISFKNY